MAAIEQEPDRRPCAARVFDSVARTGWPCARAGRIERDGKWYCKMHDPVARAEKQAARDATWRAEEKKRRDAGDRAAGYVARLGIGTAHYHSPIGSTKGSGWTGGIELTERDTLALLEYLETPADRRRWEGWPMFLIDWRQRNGTDA